MSQHTIKSEEVFSSDLSEAITRRDFLKSTAFAAGAALLSVSNAHADFTSLNSTISEKLAKNWEYFRGSLGGVWDVWRADMAENTVWKQVDVPHCFNAYDAVDPDQPLYEGPGWYRRKLHVKNPFEHGRTLLLFEAAGQKCEVFVSLENVGKHLGGYDEFVIDITDAMIQVSKTFPQPGYIPLAVRCDNSRNSEIIPSSLNDFHRFGGLYRNVTLIYVPSISIERVHISARVLNSSSAHVTVRAKLRNPSQLRDGVQLRIRILDPQGSVVQTTTGQFKAWDGEQEISTFTLANPLLWSPSRPSLYRCEVQLVSGHGTMDVTERFGCRYFEFVDHGPFKLNGEQLYLKGTQREEDHAGCGAAMPEDLIRQEMTLIKDMGANFVGLGHHQQSRAVLNLCDELGLLVLEEVPWSRGGLGGDSYKQLAREMLGTMIDQHYNHPSVIFWGLGNENDWPGDFPDFNKEQIREFVKELDDEAHKLDPSRMTFLRRCGFCEDLVDVYSPSIWAGWYHGPYTQYKMKVQREWQTVPRFLHVEWGGESHARRHSEVPDRLLSKFLSGANFDEREREHMLSGGETVAFRDGDWSETYACNLLDWHLKEQESMPWLAGSAQWIFKDFSTPMRPENPIPHVNQKGLVERDMTLKEGYYVFQSYWATTPMIRLYAHSWKARWGDPDELKLVKMYSNCEMAELFVNGVSQGVKKRNSQDFPAAGLHWLVKFKSGENHLKAIGHMKQTVVEDVLLFEYQTARWGPATQIELLETGRNRESVRVEARLLDGKNTLCLNARNRVCFGLTGDGTLLDNIGTSTGSRSVEVYNGRAEIDFLHNDGNSVVSVRCKSLPTEFLTINRHPQTS
jgi:beta-galactosidase